jgi:hypothetical protein
MIPIVPIQLFNIYVFCWILLLAILWFRDEGRRKRSFGWTVVKKRLYLCNNCQLTFLSGNTGQNVCRCPRCNELCFIRKSKIF